MNWTVCRTPGVTSSRCGWTYCAPLIGVSSGALVGGTGFVLGVWACEVSDRRLGMHDQGALVWDEVIGMWITLFAAPAQWWWMIVGFALFRLFDIWKPWPVSWADRRVHGGLGVMLDDVAAGIYALIVLQLVAALVR